MLFHSLRLFFFFLPFQIALNPSERFDMALVRVIAPLLVLAWLVSGLSRRKLRIVSGWTTPLLLSFLFLSGFSLFFAQEPLWGMRKLLFLLSFFPLFFVIADIVDTPEKLFALSRSIVWSSTLLALAGIAQFVLQFFVPIETLFRFWTRQLLPIFLGRTFALSVEHYPSLFVNIGGQTVMRASAIFPDPHMLSFYLGMTAPLALGLALASPDSASNTKRSFFLAATCLLILADLATFSRGGYVGILVGAVFFFLLRYLRNRSPVSIKKTSAILPTAAIGILAILCAVSPIGTRFISSFSLEEGSNQGRLAMWEKAAEVIAEHPFSGVGLGNYPLEVSPTAAYRDPIYAHSLLLDIAAETGILNALFFLAIVIIAWVHGFRSKINKPFLLFPTVSITVFAVHALVETPLYSVHIVPLFLFLIAGISPALPLRKT
jgi:O-antigen ligase